MQWRNAKSGTQQTVAKNYYIIRGYMSIGENLKRERLAKKVSQARLAKAAGVTQQQISYYESNHSVLSLAIAGKMARFLKIDIATLLLPNNNRK